MLGIGGWMTKVSAGLGIVGATCFAGAEVIPDPSLAPWLRFAGTIFLGLGGSGGLVGVARKVEKGPIEK